METIGELIKGHSLFSVSSNLTVAETARFMTEKRVGALPVVDGNKLVGLFSERDVITRVVSKGVDPEKTLVKDIMTTSLIVASEDESLDRCLKKMQKGHCRHLPVVSGENLVGFVSLRDLLQRDITEKEQNLEYLHSYIYTVPPGFSKKYGQ